VLDEWPFAVIEDLREVGNMSRPGRNCEVDEQQAQDRLDTDAACGHVDAAVNGSCGHVKMGMIPEAEITEAFRVPVPANHLRVGVVQEVVAVCGRAYMPALPAVLDDLKLMAEHELDGADAGLRLAAADLPTAPGLQHRRAAFPARRAASHP
jgi:hypothetical protein